MHREHHFYPSLVGILRHVRRTSANPPTLALKTCGLVDVASAVSVRTIWGRGWARRARAASVMQQAPPPTSDFWSRICDLYCPIFCSRSALGESRDGQMSRATGSETDEMNVGDGGKIHPDGPFPSSTGAGAGGAAIYECRLVWLPPSAMLRCNLRRGPVCFFTPGVSE